MLNHVLSWLSDKLIPAPDVTSSRIPLIPKFDPVRHIYQEQMCPCCDSHQSFLSGPEGGMSVNVMCENCGCRLNLTPFVFGIEWTHGPQPGIWGGKTATKYPDPKLVQRRKAAIEAL